MQPCLTQLLGRFSTYALDLLEVLVYVTIVAYWRVVWEVYDLAAYIEEIKDYRTLIFYVSHFVSFLVLFSLGLSVCISGVGGELGLMDEEVVEEMGGIVKNASMGRENLGYSSNQVSVTTDLADEQL